mmetsp:Transcript_8296/g.14220  ORF Transcript_8296/g.14220 Transcript_8296/m.14220 type:complete len:94 (+) Transcript_8296:384-665(+)
MLPHRCAMAVFLINSSSYLSKVQASHCRGRGRAQDISARSRLRIAVDVAERVLRVLCGGDCHRKEERKVDVGEKDRLAHLRFCSSTNTRSART